MHALFQSFRRQRLAYVARFFRTGISDKAVIIPFANVDAFPLRHPSALDQNRIAPDQPYSIKQLHIAALVTDAQ
jgi:hypothetical protein